MAHSLTDRLAQGPGPWATMGEQYSPLTLAHPASLTPIDKHPTGNVAHLSCSIIGSSQIYRSVCELAEAHLCVDAPTSMLHNVPDAGVSE